MKQKQLSYVVSVGTLILVLLYIAFIWGSLG